MNQCSIIFVALFLAAFGSNSRADTSWISPTGGLWREAANWSFGLPNSSQAATHIAFGGESKTITVDAATPATNLIVQRLNISGPGLTNTLSLTGVVLEVRSALQMRDGAVLEIANSTLRLPSTESALDFNAGEIRLMSGSLNATNSSSRIGRDGGVAVMRVESGLARFDELLIGRRVSRSGAQGSLLLSGGLIEIFGNLDVGADTNCHGQIIVTGGEFVAASTNFASAIGEQGNGTMITSNGIVRFQTLHVGRHTNVMGSYYIAGGSNLVEDLSLGRFASSTGLVFQTDGHLIVNDILRVGEEGRGEMRIDGGQTTADSVLIGGTNSASGFLRLGGGALSVESNLVVGTTVSTGEVVLAGGVLIATNKTSSATVQPVRGSLHVNGGSLMADRLAIADTAGHLIFHSGFVSSKSTVVSNGVPFVIGDGTNAATFQMEGGTHHFVHGLVISPNATLSGCGTIVGAINNQGTIATNCGPPAPLLMNPVRSGSEFTFSFQSKAGFSYTIEHAPRVDAEIWDVLVVTNGTGGTIIIRDPARPGDQFYRVRAQ